jgi:hypothetical protein
MLELRDGKFYREGQRVPLEFGNTEQINMINRRLKIIREGISVSPSYGSEITGYIHFKCVCGQSLILEHVVDEEGDIEQFIGMQKKCYKCLQEYTVEADGKSDLRIKYVSQKS